MKQEAGSKFERPGNQWLDKKAINKENEDEGRILISAQTRRQRGGKDFDILYFGFRPVYGSNGSSVYESTIVHQNMIRMLTLYLDMMSQ